jgi:hypothetical protein
MSVVVEHDGELYSLLVDSVGEVLSLNSRDYQRNPPTLSPRLREFSDGIYRLNGSLAGGTQRGVVCSTSATRSGRRLIKVDQTGRPARKIPIAVGGRLASGRACRYRRLSSA